MAVIITGMDMPENCANCPLTYLDTGDDAYWGLNEYRCVKDNDLIDIHDKERLEDCPLKSVDELIELIESDESITTFERFMTMGGFKFKNMIPVERVIYIIKEYCGMEDNNDADNKV